MLIRCYVRDIPLDASVYLVRQDRYWTAHAEDQFRRQPGCNNLYLPEDYVLPPGTAFKFVVVGLSEEQARLIWQSPKNDFLFRFDGMGSWFGWSKIWIRDEEVSLGCLEAWWFVDPAYPVYQPGHWYEYNVYPRR